MRLHVYGAVTLYGGPFQATSTYVATASTRVHNTTSPGGFPPGFSLPSSAFDRLYYRNRLCFLVLPLLRCFNSGGSPSMMECRIAAGSPIRASSVRRQHAPRRSISRLATPFFSTPEPSHPPSSFDTEILLKPGSVDGYGHVCTAVIAPAGVRPPGHFRPRMPWRCHAMRMMSGLDGI